MRCCLLAIFIALAYVPLIVLAEDFKYCLAAYNNGTLKSQSRHTPIETGGVDSNGAPVPPGNMTHTSNAVGLMYEVCEDACGAQQEGFQLSVFSKQFAAWLLPWLALVSQIPFGAKLRKHHIVTVFLTVGSPALAAYSLILTVLNGHYVAQRFSHYTYPNAGYAIRILSGLQQAPLRIVTDHGLLASLVVLPRNDRWWVNMARSIDYEHTWSISALANITWVIIAYFFTVAESFSNVTDSINSNGQGVGALWLWLLPIVVGWLQISPKCDYNRLYVALSETNERYAHIATEDPDITRCTADEQQVGPDRAFMFEQYDVFSPSFDSAITSPIFNYSRIFSWMMCVERVSEAFEAASLHAQGSEPVNVNLPWKPAEDFRQERIHVDNRGGTITQVENYCHLAPEVMTQHVFQWRVETFHRILTASVIALALQWATASSAIIIVWFTPTTKLGCRSGAYLLYGAASTLVWAMLVTSTILAYYATDHVNLRYNPKSATSLQRIACRVSIIMNNTAKVMAALNSIWVISVSIFQFASVFNNCYCNSSVLGRGRLNAYSIIDISKSTTGEIIKGWGGGVALSVSTCFLFIAYVQVFLDNPIPQEN